MWRSDRAFVGPIRATLADIDALNRVFSDAFTERYRRDGLSGVRVPYLNPAVWQFAIADAAEGAMIWRDGTGDLVAFNIVHRSGSEGWMGPLAVRIDRQGRGHGRQIVEAGVAWLAAAGVRTIGLETMPRTIDNVGFYSRLGFVPNHLTVTLQRERPRADGASGRLSQLQPVPRQQAVEACQALTARVAAEIDFSREVELTVEQQLGDVSLVHDARRALRSFALWHTAPLAQGRSRDEVRLLKLVAVDTDAALAAVRATEAAAASMSMSRVSVRCQTRHAAVYAALIADGFRVQWTDLRMTLAGKEEAKPDGVLFSNWEI
ncbi:MAG: GNAT family N-acetyltransferase [Gemmatimonadales bacterium]